MSSIRNLHEARRERNDDFYTQLPDIESELTHYRHHFRGKVVYCNCDDPKISNFYHYFSHNFNALGLKRLITTCYRNQQPDLFSNHEQENSVWLECSGMEDENGGSHPKEPVIRHLEGDGDFRSAECVELLKQADIVVTNPPFSLFREYVAQLIEHDKKFVIIGNMNAITYKEIFPLFKENRVWFGASIKSGDREFGVPDHYPLKAATTRIDENGKKFIRVKGVRWFTNLDIEKRHEDLILYQEYSPDKYAMYDDHSAINVDKTKDIPQDWDGIMGVPITFLDKYNPSQFEILGIANSARWIGYKCATLIKGRKTYNRILIRRK